MRVNGFSVSHLRIRALALAVVLGVVAMACGGSDASGPSRDTENRGEVTLKGSGATFPQAFYEVCIAAYAEGDDGVTVEYAGGGSGTGRQNLQDQVVDFAGTDAVVKEEDKPRYKGGELLYVPTVAAPITVSYNLPELSELVLDADTIARIFQRQVTRWDDRAITNLNPGAPLPSTDIIVAHRSDGSGTTENFTRYLSGAAPSTWALGSGSTVEWPADTQAGNGNSGVASIVKDNLGAIGYVDLSDARATGLQTATVRNRAGRPVQPTLEAASAALAGVTVSPDLTYNPLDAPGDTAYPITAPTWILVYKNQTDPAKGEALRSFLRFLLTDCQALAGSVDYARLPDSLGQKALAQVDAMVVPTA
jgi:phosphate transport system substrate-binding protein